MLRHRPLKNRQKKLLSFGLKSSILLRKLKLEELNRPGVDQYKEYKKIPVVIVLEDIRSLSNIGAIFRTADAFIIEAIYLVGITACPPHREIQKTALGATESVDWLHFQSTEKCIEQLRTKEYRIFAVEQTEKSKQIDEALNESGKGFALILGNEVEGVQQSTINQCDGSIEIPQFGTKHSLNVSVCAGIIMYEFMQHYLNLASAETV